MSVVAALLIALLPALASHADTGSQVTLDQDTFEVGGVVTVSYETDQPSDTNWVAIYDDATPEPGSGLGMEWTYTPGESGIVDLPLHDRSGNDLPPGSYRIEFLADDGWERLSEPVDFVIEGDEPTDPGVPDIGPVDPVETGPATDGVIYRETFDGAGQPGEAPADWSNDGWNFTTREGWRSDIDRMRHRFGRAQDTIAVADPATTGHDGVATLTSEALDVDGEAELRLAFDSHYRGADGQVARVTVAFDDGDDEEIVRLDDESVESGYDAPQMNANRGAEFDVPDGASTARFTWEFTPTGDGHYWGIDSVAVHRVQSGPDGEPTTAWAVSDIQGHPHDLAQGLQSLSELRPDADGLLMVGDIVDNGYVHEWDEVYEVMEDAAAILPPQLVATMGNHERHGADGFEVHRDRLLEFAGRDRVWDEYVLEGPGGEAPVIALGQEFAQPSDVAMSAEQVEFLADRLAHWTEQDRQVFVLTHYPFGNTVSASWIPWYSDHHQYNDELTDLLANYPNAIVLSGHTHYPADLGDWSMQRRTETGHADGFWAVNTLAMHVEWDSVGENTDGITEVTTGDINRGLTVDVYDDRTIVTAYDFFTDEELRQVEIPNPLVTLDDPSTPPPGGPGDENGDDDGNGDANGGGDGSGTDAGASDDGISESAGVETAPRDSLPGTGAAWGWWALVIALALVLGGAAAMRRGRNLGG